MNILIGILCFGCTVLLCLYIAQQFMNGFSVSCGKVPISIVRDGKEIDSFVINTIKKVKFNIVFGLQGSGKTTYLAYIVDQVEKINKKRIEKGLLPLNIYSNITLFNCHYQYITKDDIGHMYLHDGIILYDESALDFNNRRYKSLSFEAIEYFKKHRHYNVSIYCFSQSYEDCDITLRRLASDYFHIHKSILYFINHHIIIRGISKFLFIDKEEKQIVEGYKYKMLSKFRINGKKYFKYFSSFERDLQLVGD